MLICLTLTRKVITGALSLNIGV